MSGHDDRRLAGVGGWLIFFLIGVGLISPVIIIVSIVGLYSDPQVALAYGDAWPVLEKIEWVIAAGQLGLLWYMSWRLLQVHVWQTVRIVIAGIWIVAPGVSVVETLAVCLIGGVPFNEMAALMSVGFARNLVYCAIWTAYFLKSERVANTYLREHKPEEMAEVFS